MRVIEICNNEEWLTVFGPLCDLENTDCESEACRDWWTKLSNRIESRFSDVETQTPCGQRILCHGWNGANTFRRIFSGMGTFDEFSGDEWDEIENMYLEVSQIVCDEWRPIQW